ncbi:protein spaetzle 4 [Drosophila albomicans]|uniref:Protein spaetzle 4 n=1 Tax=Drosophila albomicans TaxID=7291 RepID=A0A6P8XDI3_DROAB|nr:protein spaetzle 4 [Drosophila albomicans]
MELMKMNMRISRLRTTKLITRNTVVALLFIFLVNLTDSTANFGFDSANSCNPNGKISRRGRAQMLAAIPCDLAKQPFCHLPGSIYPWHAVRRFVHENQGLMKRMYGDVRHISILRDEIQNNEVVDVDDIEDAADRYSKTPRGAKFMLQRRDGDRDEFGSYKGIDVIKEPHFRPVSAMGSTTTPSTTSTTVSSSPTTAPTSSSSSPTTLSISSGAAIDELQLETVPDGDRERPSLESNSVYELPSSTSSKTVSTSTTSRPQTTERANSESGDNIEVIAAPQLGEAPKKVEGSQGLHNISIATVPVTLATVVKVSTTATKRTTAVPSRKQKPSEAPTPSTTPLKVTLKATNSNTSTADTAASGATVSNTSTVGLMARKNVTKTTMGSTTPVSFASLFSSTFTALSMDKQKRPLTTSTTAAPPMTSSKAGLLKEGGQLFQDAIKQEPVAVTSNMRGVNACPVKDEVVAPFWANNTRGEVLALLNLYPFEQYVHWEKCTHEFKQMFCRDGCRCEQQYRLHRLLAYDPHNECRGIFSDWFRFPSSCICKCYNIPMEFRATSRSPRSDNSFDAPQSQPIDPIGAAEAEVQRAIYEHATDQWYRPRDEFDIFEG